MDDIDELVAFEKKFHWTIPIRRYNGKSLMVFIQSAILYTI
jgi:hypothetical protein